MNWASDRTKRRVLTGLAVLTGCTFASGLLPSCETALTTVNPCGSILGFCDPTDIDLLFADVPDFELDPTCTIPYFDETLFEGGGGGGGQQQNLGICAGGPIFPFTPGPRPD
ncbi:MAG: hypothetical protein ACYSUI_19415 [Planctomycetota bacterium]|jgi:hypothetical protein